MVFFEYGQLIFFVISFVMHTPMQTCIANTFLCFFHRTDVENSTKELGTHTQKMLNEKNQHTFNVVRELQGLPVFYIQSTIYLSLVCRDSDVVFFALRRAVRGSGTTIKVNGKRSGSMDGIDPVSCFRRIRLE